jgi:gas vesicle protein
MLCTKKEKMDNLENDEHGTCCGTLFLSFLAGAAVGAGLSLLYAPKTGKELREKIGELTDDAVDKIKTYATEAQEKIKSTIEDSKEVIKEKKAILTSAFEAGKEAMELEKDKYRNKEA